MTRLPTSGEARIVKESTRSSSGLLLLSKELALLLGTKPTVGMFWLRFVYYHFQSVGCSRGESRKSTYRGRAGMAAWSGMIAVVARIAVVIYVWRRSVRRNHTEGLLVGLGRGQRCYPLWIL